MTELAIRIPDDLRFDDLQLALDPVTREVSFNGPAIERIATASGLPAGYFFQQGADALGGLIAYWYGLHLQAGGPPDPVQQILLHEPTTDPALH